MFVLPFAQEAVSALLSEGGVSQAEVQAQLEADFAPHALQQLFGPDGNRDISFVQFRVLLGSAASCARASL